MEPASTTAQGVGGLTAVVMATPQSEVAQSLFSADLHQLLTLSFELQVGDFVGILGLLFALDAFWSRRKSRQKTQQPDPN